MASTGCAPFDSFETPPSTNGSLEAYESQTAIRNPSFLESRKILSARDGVGLVEDSLLAGRLRDGSQTSCTFRENVERSLVCQDNLDSAIVNFCNLTSNAELLITPQMVNEPGDEYVNGPTVMKVPEWVSKPLGNYYMYFADHRGQYIRMAYSDSLRGPWRVLAGGGVFSIADAEPLSDHIASPDIWVDDSSRKIWLSLHGRVKKGDQRTILVESLDGLAFNRSADYRERQFSNHPYVRIFEYKGSLYTAVLTKKGVEISSGSSITGTFTPVATILTQENGKIRHIGVGVVGSSLHIYFSRKGDSPERILRATVDMSLAPSEWDAARPVECVRSPQETWEGVGFPSRPSERGPGNNLKQLRDPFVYADETHQVLFYSVAGESGIAIADLR